MEFIYSHPILSGLQAAFTIWMLVDAYRRQADTYWYYVILFVPLLGSWAYFFAVKSADFKHLHWPGFLHGRPSLDELRFRCEQTPTLATHLALAERLIEKEQHEEALAHLEAAAKTESDHGQVLFDRARCHARLGQPEQARSCLERLIQKEPRWSYYAAWHLLIEILDESGDSAHCIEICRALVKLAPSLQNQCVLAEHLLDTDQADEAVALLDRALREYQYGGGAGRRHNRRWAALARQLLKRAGAA